jgi:uncharacterized lipoprotein
MKSKIQLIALATLVIILAGCAGPAVRHEVRQDNRYDRRDDRYDRRDARW